MTGGAFNRLSVVFGVIGAAIAIASDTTDPFAKGFWGAVMGVGIAFIIELVYLVWKWVTTGEWGHGE